MGNKAALVTPPTIEQTLIELKMASKSFKRQQAGAEKKKKQYIKKAKEALKKNKQEEARLYLGTAASKQKEAANFSKMAVKMELLSDTVKSNEANKTIIQNYNRVTEILMNNNTNAEVIATDLQKFHQVVDQTLVNAKLIQELIQINNTGVELVADQMLDVLKKQIAAEIQQQNQIKPIVHQQPGLTQADLKFLNDLKALV